MDPSELAAVEEPQVWRAEEVAAFLAFVDDHPWRELWHLAIAIGMRRGELLGLRWADADLDRARITVRRSLPSADGVLRLLGTKTSKLRVVSLTASTAALLRERRAAQAAHRADASAWDDDWGLVFADERGAPLPPPTVTQEFRRLMRHAPVPTIRFPT